MIWDGVFPDRRDARHLGILPLPGRTLILARVLALCALAGLFLIGVNAIPTLTYGSLAAEYGAARGTWRGIIAQGLASGGAGVLAFFALIGVQGALLNVAGRQAAERLALLLQVVMVALLLQLVLLLPQLRTIVHADLAGVASDPWLRWIPSCWFLGLHDLLAGYPSPGATRLAGMAIAATVMACAGAIVLFAGTHRRLMRAALESRDASVTRGVIVAAIVTGIVRLIDRGALSRAVAAFILLTLIRSRPHRLLLATYVGLACAIVVSANGPSIARDGWGALRTPGLMTLTAPFVLQFCAAIGARLLLAIPAEPRANWLLRLYEPRDRRLAIDTVRNVLLTTIVAPIATAAGVSALLLWDPAVAVLHATMVAGMGWLLIEALLIEFRKIPFACTYFPGRSRVRTLWPFYLVALLLYAIGTAALELDLLAHPWRVLPVIMTLSILIASLTWLRARRLAEPIGLRFAEEDFDEPTRLDLSN
jgi:hypothetical protein